MRNAYKILVAKPSHIWEDNIRMDLREIRWVGVDCVLDAAGSVNGSVAGCCEHGNETSGSINGGGIF
jgi:hypothetical protein